MQAIAEKEYADRIQERIKSVCPEGSACQNIIALVPDPRHTHLALQFDRAIEAIQEALQDGGFVFDRALVPWDPKIHQESDDYEKRHELEEWEEATERWPGLMAFRGEKPSQWALVFLVSETPTGGIQEKEFGHALCLVDPRRECSPDAKQTAGSQRIAGLRILGPTFSGSLASLERLLAGAPAPGSQAASIYSGTITSRKAVLDFAGHERDLNMRFISFQESDEVMLQRFIDFLAGNAAGFWDFRRYVAKNIAILSEDETAYGGGPPSGAADRKARDDPNYCETDDGKSDFYCVLKLTFPREISQLRAAYQDNAAGPSSGDARVAPRGTLPSNFSVPGSGDDTVAAFSPKQMPLSQESVMLGIVAELQKHRIEHVILRATDPMDSLFLAEHLRAAFPQGRVVTIGADLLFRREADNPLLHGLLALSTYSLEPSGNHGFANYEQRHFERIFPSTDAAGTYNAMRALLVAPGPFGTNWLLDHELAADPDPWCDEVREVTKGCIHLYQYGWLREPTNGAPPVHLLALGRDQYWPIANLGPGGGNQPKTLPRIPGQIAIQMERPLKIPASWQAVQIIAIILALGFSVCVWFSSIYSKTQAMARFAPAAPDLRGVLVLVIGWSFEILLLMLLWPTLKGDQASPDLVRCLLAIALMALFASTVCDWVSRHRGLFKCWLPPFCFFALSAALAWVTFRTYPDDRASVLHFMVLRSVQLTSGLSFIMPCAFFLAVWLWLAYYGALGCALVDDRQPRLPENMCHPRVARLADKEMMELIEGRRFDWRWAGVYGIIAAGFLASFWMLGNHWHPLVSLERPSVEWLMAVLFAAGVIGLIMVTLRLSRVWLGTRRLLLALDALPLRHGFERVRGFSWKPIWRLGAGSLDEFQRVFNRKREAFDRYVNTLPGDCSGVDCAMAATMERSREARSLGARFTWNWLKRREAELEVLKQFKLAQLAFAKEAGAALDCLAQSWLLEKLVPASDKVGIDPKVSACERFVCMVYIDYLVATLLRIRSLIVAIGGMYVFLLIGVTQYPFEPRGAIQLMLALLLAFIVIGVGTVFAQLHRDATLSHITDTKPGELGTDFYLRMAGFVALPLFSFLASQFPSVNRLLYSWLQPVIQSLNR
ncbi:MAG: hypothetical protein ABSH50_31220 [Bryobacteraceae bacterium]